MKMSQQRNEAAKKANIIILCIKMTVQRSTQEVIALGLHGSGEATAGVLCPVLCAKL